MSDVLRFLEGLPPGPLYAAITLLAGVENIFPPVPADTAVAFGAFLAGRGRLDPWLVFGLTWSANVSTAAAVYLLARVATRRIAFHLERRADRYTSGRSRADLASALVTLDRLSRAAESDRWNLFPVYPSLRERVQALGEDPSKWAPEVSNRSEARRTASEALYLSWVAIPVAAYCILVVGAIVLGDP